MKRLLAVVGVSAGLLAVAFAVGAYNVRAAPVLRETRVTLPGWPSDAPPLTVALISDIHMGDSSMTPDRLRSVVARINAARPDLVLIAGDFVVGHDAAGARERAEALTEPLAGLKAPLGTVAVLGNHDFWTSATDVRAALEKAGVTVLDNTARQYGPIAVVGVSDSFSGHDRIATAMAAAGALTGPRVVLTHSPDVAGRLPASVPLVLAGHTHCGQIVAPLVGSLVGRSPREGFRPLYDPRYRCGVVRDPGRTVIVTAGVGSGSVPIRLGAPTDWWLIELGR